MIYRFVLHIIAAFLSFALSSIVTTIDEATSLAVSNIECENLLCQYSETFFIDDTPTIRHFSSSGRCRLSIRRTPHVYNVAIDNSTNTILNTPHRLICLTHSDNPSGFNEPARYLIRLRKFII